MAGIEAAAAPAVAEWTRRQSGGGHGSIADHIYCRCQPLSPLLSFSKKKFHIPALGFFLHFWKSLFLFQHLFSI
jgi:hypothetical protein